MSACMHAPMQCFQNALAYFATVVSYARKMLMKSITGVCTTKPFSYNLIFPWVKYLTKSPVEYWFIETKTGVFIHESDGLIKNKWN